MSMDFYKFTTVTVMFMQNNNATKTKKNMTQT